MSENPDTQQPGTQPESVEALPEWAQTLIADLRSENAAKRTENKALTTERDELAGKVEELSATVQLTDDTVKEHEATIQGLKTTSTKEHLLYEAGLPLKYTSMIPDGDEDAMKTAVDSLAELRGSAEQAQPAQRPDPAQAAEPATDEREALAKQIFG